MGDRKFGIDTDILDYLSKEISDVKDKFKKIRIAMVVGGGNIWRGADYEKLGMDRSVADSAGMLATMINGLALQDALENINLPFSFL